MIFVCLTLIIMSLDFYNNMFSNNQALQLKVKKNVESYCRKFCNKKKIAALECIGHMWKTKILVVSWGENVSIYG